MNRNCNLLFGVLFLGLASPLQADAPKAVTVPFELLKTKHMTVMIKVNGKGPYRVIFDTGAPVTVLNNKVAKESGLLKDIQKPLFSLFGAVGQVNAETLEIGDLKADDVPVMIMDHPTVEAISMALGPIEGIVGFPFFARYRMTLDYQARTMTFVPNGYNPPDAIQALMTMLLAGGRDKPAKQVIAPAAQWGMVVDKAPGEEEAGVTIKEVFPGSAADAAGLRAGDRLLTLDGRWTDSINECYSAAAHVKPGAAVKVTVQRGGAAMELTVKPASGL
ncbi:MAG TPA: aspartyl protease family protein [Gemmataceae bacterium]|nr:aspartyl protease family protein [Gemmataceae bacterium]